MNSSSLPFASMAWVQGRIIHFSKLLDMLSCGGVEINLCCFSNFYINGAHFKFVVFAKLDGTMTNTTTKPI
jgi:hypothetical protein